MHAHRAEPCLPMSESISCSLLPRIMPVFLVDGPMPVSLYRSPCHPLCPARNIKNLSSSTGWCISIAVGFLISLFSFLFSFSLFPYFLLSFVFVIITVASYDCHSPRAHLILVGVGSYQQPPSLSRPARLQKHLHLLFGRRREVEIGVSIDVDSAYSLPLPKF